MNSEFNAKYAVFAGQVEPPRCPAVPADAQRKIVCMDASAIPGCIFTNAGWYMSDLEVTGLRAHNSDEVLMLLGGDKDAHECLNAEFEIQIENDILHLEKSCSIFIPAGAAHGNIKIKNLKKPILYCVCHPYTDSFEEHPAEPSAEKGRYANSFVDKYDTTGVRLPNVGPDVITRIYYLDSRRVPGAPYFESVWFNNTPAFLEPHVHKLDEVIFFAGTDPEHPEDLGGKINFYVEGKPIEITKSCILFIPAGVEHNPFEIMDLKQPVLHFSGGNNVSYDVVK